MAFSKTRSMTPLSRSSVSMDNSITCFISCWNICGVSLLRMLRTRRSSSCKDSRVSKSQTCPLLPSHRPPAPAPTCVLMFSGSSSSEARLLLGFQAFSALFSLTSSLRDTVAMILRGSFLWLCWERRGPKPEG